MHRTCFLRPDGPQFHIRLCRAGDQIALIVKAGAVARAVPAFLLRVPFQLAAQMGAADVDGIEGPVLCPVGADLLPAQTHHAAVTGRELIRA